MAVVWRTCLEGLFVIADRSFSAKANILIFDGYLSSKDSITSTKRPGAENGTRKLSAWWLQEKGLRLGSSRCRSSRKRATCYRFFITKFRDVPASPSRLQAVPKPASRCRPLRYLKELPDIPLDEDREEHRKRRIAVVEKKKNRGTMRDTHVNVGRTFWIDLQLFK